VHTVHVVVEHFMRCRGSLLLWLAKQNEFEAHSCSFPVGLLAVEVSRLMTPCAPSTSRYNLASAQGSVAWFGLIHYIRFLFLAVTLTSINTVKEVGATRQ